MKYIVLLLAILLSSCGKKQATKQLARIVDLHVVEHGFIRQKENVLFTIVELEDGSRHQLSGDWGEIDDTITVWTGNGRTLTRPFEY